MLDQAERAGGNHRVNSPKASGAAAREAASDNGFAGPEVTDEEEDESDFEL